MPENSSDLATIDNATPESVARDCLVTGASVEESLAVLSRTFPGCDGLAAINAAVDRLRGLADCDTQTVVGWALDAYRTVYQRALACNDLAPALRAIKELVALARDIPAGGNVRDDEEAEEDATAEG